MQIPRQRVSEYVVNRRATDVPWDHDPNGHLPLVLEQFAMENGPFIFDLPIKMDNFSCFFIVLLSV